MEKKEIKLEMKELDLVQHAIKAQKNSQSKYSNFPVGCAILCDNNSIIYGCNIESAVYPSTLCAERVAIYSALSQGLTKFKAIAIVSNNSAKPDSGPENSVPAIGCPGIKTTSLGRWPAI